MKARALFLLLLFMSPAIYADDTKNSTDSKVNTAVTTGALVFLVSKAGAISGVIKGIALGCSGLIIPVGGVAVVGIAGYGLKKGWDWFIADVKADMKRVETKVDILDEKTDSVKSEVAEGRTEAYGRFDTLDGNIDNLQEGQADIKKRFPTLATKQQVSKLSESQQTIQERQEELRKTMLEKLMEVSEEAGGDRKKILDKITENSEEAKQSMNLCNNEVSELKKILLDNKKGNNLLHEKLNVILEVVYGVLPSDDSRRNRLKELTGRNYQMLETEEN